MITVDKEALKEIAELTGANLHTLARIELCNSIFQPELAQKYEGVQAMQNCHGYLPDACGKLRNKFDKELFDIVETTCTNADEVEKAF